MKHILKTFAIAGLLVAIVGGSVLLQKGRAQTTPPAQTVETNQVRTVSVSGVGQVEAVPDVATVRLGVRTDAETAQEALTQNNSQMQSLLDALVDSGVSRQDIQTQSIQLFPRYEEQPAQQTTVPGVIGYTAINTVQVQVRDLDNLGETLDSAVQAGGNTIESISFDVSNPTELLAQAREAAMNDARDKADQLASLADADLGTVLAINEGAFTPLPLGRGGDIAVQESLVPIEAGTQTITVNIQVTWELTSGQTPSGTSGPTPTGVQGQTPSPTQSPGG
jgi:uncharacterized protein YggE